LLNQYKHLMYLNISDNRISSLEVIGEIPALVQLVANDNQIEDCLKFAPPLCTPQNAWSTGQQAIGSVLTSVDLRNNKILKINNLSDHRFLEFLLLSGNMISQIEGLMNLAYLKVPELITLYSLNFPMHPKKLALYSLQLLQIF
jgi:Leucine-rich repeat (LRR) protein